MENIKSFDVKINKEFSNTIRINFNSNLFEYSCFMHLQFDNEEKCSVRYEYGMLQELYSLTTNVPISVSRNYLYDIILFFNKLDDYLFTIEFKNRKLSIWGMFDRNTPIEVIEF